MGFGLEAVPHVHVVVIAEKAARSCIDLTGQRFASLIVQKRAGASNSSEATWLCLCDCGTERIVSGGKLRNGESKACYSCDRKRRGQLLATDLTSKRIGRLKVIDRAGTNARGLVTWNCVCDCGEMTVATAWALKHENKRSCGCLVREHNQNQIEDLTGQQFGSLTVLKLAQRHPIRWLCQCICGIIRDFSAGGLKKGGATSCGCQTTWGFNQSRPAIVYYLKIDNPYDGTLLYKIGVTNRTVAVRYVHEFVEYRILMIMRFKRGLDAYKYEQRILNTHREHWYNGPPVLVNGNSELFTCDVLKRDRKAT